MRRTHAHASPVVSVESRWQNGLLEMNKCYSSTKDFCDKCFETEVCSTLGPTSAGACARVAVDARRKRRYKNSLSSTSLALIIGFCLISVSRGFTATTTKISPVARSQMIQYMPTQQKLTLPRIQTSLLLFPNTNDDPQQVLIASLSRPQRRRWWNPLRNFKADAEADYDPFATANDIAPKTKPLGRSVGFYAWFVIDRLEKSRHAKYRIKQRGRRRAMWKSLNEQRKNVIQLANYTRHIAVPSFFFLFLGALTTSIIPLFYSRCLQAVSTLSGSRAELMKNLAGLLIMSILGAAFTGARGSLFWIGGSRTNYNIRVKLHRSLLMQDAAFFDMNETGYLLSRLNSDVNRIGAVISYHVNIVCRQFAQFVFGSIYMFRISPRLSVWTFGGVLLVAWVSAVYGDFARELAERVQNTFADATAVAETSFSMSETIRAYDGVEIESERFENAQSKALELEEVQAWGYGTHKFVSDTLQSLLSVGLLLSCYVIGKNGGLEAGKLMTFLFYSNFVLESSNEVGDEWAKIQSAVGASTSVFDLIKRVPGVRDPPVASSGSNIAQLPVVSSDGSLLSPEIATPVKSNGVSHKSKDDGHLHVNGDAEAQRPLISMKDMTVTYGAMDRPALDGINLDIFPGDRIAIVGRSGSGKSTMLRSILRFYDPSHGSITLDGLDLSSMTRSELSKKVTVVQQEPQLFPMSLLENVLYNIPKDEVDPETEKPCYSEALRQAAFDALSLAGLPIQPGNELTLDLDTRVGEGGRSLSGGQRQRVAIARAVLRKPRVLLLDEPTAALDSESEKKVVDSLNKAMSVTKSIVMVTHRLGVIRSLEVNRVIVLDKGRIVETGHPEDLLQNENGLYTSLAREQGILADKRQLSKN